MLTDPALWLDQVGLTLLGELSKHDVRVRDKLPVVLRRVAEIAAIGREAGARWWP